MKCIAENIAAAYRGSCQVELKKGSSTVMNDKQMANLVSNAIVSVLGKDNVITDSSAALMGSDDFANYAEKIPGVYFFLHTNNSVKGIIESNHNPRFDIDESVLWEGVAAYVAIAVQYLK